jgi:beta-lactamase regulating signal transducer with metallopeptidase domain
MIYKIFAFFFIAGAITFIVGISTLPSPAIYMISDNQSSSTSTSTISANNEITQIITHSSQFIIAMIGLGILISTCLLILVFYIYTQYYMYERVEPIDSKETKQESKEELKQEPKHEQNRVEFAV